MSATLVLILMTAPVAIMGLIQWAVSAHLRNTRQTRETDHGTDTR